VRGIVDRCPSVVRAIIFNDKLMLQGATGANLENANCGAAIYLADHRRPQASDLQTGRPYLAAHCAASSVVPAVDHPSDLYHRGGGIVGQDDHLADDGGGARRKSAGPIV
jgi:hypothetical protein